MIVLIKPNSNVSYNNTRLPSSVNKAQGIYNPLGLAYLASSIEKNGYKVQIIDMEVEDIFGAEIKNRLREIKPDFVGVTSMTPNVRGALEILKFTKEVSKGIKTIIGGVQMSVYPKETVSPEYVDYGIVGEGEESFVDLLDGKLGADGLIFKDNGNIIINKPRAPNNNISDLPFPARHLLAVEKYSSVIMKHPMTSILAARGCPFNCNFCYRDESLKYRGRSVTNVVDEMQECVERWKVKEIAFYNDCFPNKQWMRELCEAILRRNIKVSWSSPQRIDLVDKELLQLMKRSGCIGLRYGVESGNQLILDLMNKQTKLADIEQVFKLTKDAGIETFGYFMIGYASEDKNTIQDTINFAKKLNPDWLMFTVATPLPNTEFMNQVKDKIDPEYWRKYTLGEDVGRIPFVMEGADKYCEQAYKSFYLRPQFIFKKIAKLRDFDQFKKYSRGAMSLLRFRMV